MKKRKDSRNRVLLPGESSRIKNGKDMYCFRWTDSFGKRHAVYSTDLNELRRKEREIDFNRMHGIRTPGNMTVNDEYKVWCEVKKGLKENTFQNYRYMYDAFVAPSIGKVKLSNIKKSDVKRYYINLHEDMHLKVRTIDLIHTVLFQVFELACDDGYLRNNPAHNAMTELKKMNKDSEKKEALTIKQQRLFENCLDLEENKWVKPIFLTMLDAGLRVGEVTGLRWCDIDLDQKVIDVNHTLVYYQKEKENKEKQCGYGINTPKTENSKRKVAMTDRLANTLQEYKSILDEKNLYCIDHIDGYTDFAFFNPWYRTVYNQGTLNKKLKRIQRDCNMKTIEECNDDNAIILPKFTCHQLRHTAATRLCESGVNPRYIMDTLGHADIRTTMNIYVDVTNELKKAEVEKFEAYIVSNSSKK